MNNEDKQLLATIVESMQEKKAKKITVVDMTKLEAPCHYFVICQGESNTQVSAIADSVKDGVRENLRLKPFGTDGYDNSLWVALDYGTAIVHVFQPEPREFYDLEHLWEDAEIKQIPDLD
ncbi:MAG: ribosome silencing factor [Paludibacteraceae bacterium]|nr:ribosome silencing factor [Paludibacteraceae bacterium]